MAKSDDLNLYFFNPSRAAAALFTVLYGLLCLAHFYINFISTRSPRCLVKHKYTIPLFVACIISTAGWGVRIASISSTSSVSLYAVSASCVVISPIFVCASLYLLLTRLIRTRLPEYRGRQVFFRIPPRWLGRIFIVSDVFSFLTQCSGSGIASAGNWEGNTKDIGMNVLLAGLALQLGTFTAFLVVLFRFVRTAGWSPITGGQGKDGGVDQGLDTGAKKVVLGVWIASFFVQVRTIYRVVEFALGIDGYPFNHEWPLYVLEATPMFFALAVLAWFHPVRYLQPHSSAEVLLPLTSRTSVVTDSRRSATKGPGGDVV